MSFPMELPGAKVDTLMWADPYTIESQAREQLLSVSELPWVEKLRVMPDVHYGKGATVGSVIAMKDAVSASAVGVDLGCGMQAVKTSLKASDLGDDLHTIRSNFESVVPVGFEANDDLAPVLKKNEYQKLSSNTSKLIAGFSSLRAQSIEDRERKMVNQIGTLGGGNHFIELCLDDDQNVWVTLHSGSRNIGKEIAERHISLAKGLEHNLKLKNRELSVFLGGTPEMEDYMHDLFWAQDYARINREVMMASLKDQLKLMFPNVTFEPEISCHHNYVSHETLSDVGEVVVTRKGAISAHDGQLGMIPGSMATGSYIVEGTGNETGLYSASHGAGRRMSRGRAKRTYSVEDLIFQTEGVECRKDSAIVDEIPSAYKSLESVIDAQSKGENPLVRVVCKLDTILCVKG